MISIITIGSTHSETISPGTEFQVKAVGNGLISIVAATPVGNDGSVEAPIPFQHIVQEIAVMTNVLTFVQII